MKLFRRSPLELAINQAINLELPPLKNPVERHAERIAGILDNLRRRKDDEIIERTRLAALVADTHEREAELDHIIAAFEAAEARLKEAMPQIVEVVQPEYADTDLIAASVYGIS